MLSFSKILLLALLIGVLWFGWRWYARVGAVGRDHLREGRPDRGRGASAAGPAPRVGAEDMEKCPECGAYVAPRSAVSCGRPGCPYGR